MEQQKFYVRGWQKKNQILAIIVMPIIVLILLKIFLLKDLSVFTIIFGIIYSLIYFALLREAYIIDKETNTLRTTIFWGLYTKKGRPISDYIKAQKNSKNPYKVELHSRTGVLFIQMQEAEAFCRSLNKAIEESVHNTASQVEI